MTIGDPAPPGRAARSRSPDQELAAALADPSNWSAQLPGDGPHAGDPARHQAGRGGGARASLGELTRAPASPAARRHASRSSARRSRSGRCASRSPRRASAAIDATLARASREGALRARAVLRAERTPRSCRGLGSRRSRPAAGSRARASRSRPGWRRTSATRTSSSTSIRTRASSNGADSRRPTGRRPRWRRHSPRGRPRAGSGARHRVGRAGARRGIDVRPRAAEEPGATVAEGLTYTEALERMRDHEAGAPEDRGELQVVGAHEAVA